MLIPERVALKAYESWEASLSGCYISTYSVASHGYAQIGWQDRDMARSQMTLAHRAAWTHIHGQIPDDMTVDHDSACIRPCVNVEHLRLLTNFENARRTNGRDWPLGECINGHSNDELREYSDKDNASGKRLGCRLCRRQYQIDYRARKKKTLYAQLGAVIE